MSKSCGFCDVCIVWLHEGATMSRDCQRVFFSWRPLLRPSILDIRYTYKTTKTSTVLLVLHLKRMERSKIFIFITKSLCHTAHTAQWIYRWNICMKIEILNCSLDTLHDNFSLIGRTGWQRGKVCPLIVPWENCKEEFARNAPLYHTHSYAAEGRKLNLLSQQEQTFQIMNYQIWDNRVLSMSSRFCLPNLCKKKNSENEISWIIADVRSTTTYRRATLLFKILYGRRFPHP